MNCIVKFDALIGKIGKNCHFCEIGKKFVFFYDYWIYKDYFPDIMPKTRAYEVKLRSLFHVFQSV